MIKREKGRDPHAAKTAPRYLIQRFYFLTWLNLNITHARWNETFFHLSIQSDLIHACYEQVLRKIWMKIELIVRRRRALFINIELDCLRYYWIKIDAKGGSELNTFWSFFLHLFTSFVKWVSGKWEDYEISKYKEKFVGFTMVEFNFGSLKFFVKMCVIKNVLKKA